MLVPEALRGLLEEYLDGLSFASELHGQEASVRYALAGGKRVRGVICLATAEAAGACVATALPAAAALELVHAFSLVHDDLPALDDDAERRGKPSVWAEFGEAVAVLAGDALLAEGFRQALSYPTTALGRELADATLGMIGGQYLDITAADVGLAEVHRLKTGKLFAASVGLGLWAAGVAEGEQAPWRAFGEELGLLFQLVDDLLDGDGFAQRVGVDGARTLVAEATARARARLDALDAEVDATVLAAIVDNLAVRTA
jgi:geranylgeranyl pyrophosphate synthase